MDFSANLGVLWADLSLKAAAVEARAAGFAAIECHWPYGTDPMELRDHLTQLGLPLVSLNTLPGNRTAGDFGVLADPLRVLEGRVYIDKALNYARLSGAKAVHLMAGKGHGAQARQTFLDHLQYASDGAGAQITLLIEVINPYDVPDYFLNDVQQALDLIADAGRDNVKFMLDAYHLARLNQPLIPTFKRCQSVLGHVQIARCPDRGPPSGGDVDMIAFCHDISRLGWDRPIGAEYLPHAPTDETLDWLAPFRQD